MLVFYLILWFLFIVIETFRNYYSIEIKKERPNYTVSFIFRGMGAIFHGILFKPMSMEDYFPIFIFQITSFWIVFDLLLNLLRKKPIFYSGSSSGILDNIGIKNKVVYISLKLIAVLLLVQSIIMVLNGWVIKIPF